MYFATNLEYFKQNPKNKGITTGSYKRPETKLQNFFKFIYTKIKRKTCKYESPREETREVHDRLAVKRIKRVYSGLCHHSVPRERLKSEGFAFIFIEIKRAGAKRQTFPKKEGK
jgi:hypothetical protein